LGDLSHSLPQKDAKLHLISCAKLQLDNGAKIDPSDIEPPLRSAIECGNLSMVQFLLLNHANPNRSYLTWGAPLHRAIQNRSWNIVKLLVDAGADCKKKALLNNNMVHIEAGESMSPVEFANRTGSLDSLSLVLGVSRSSLLPPTPTSRKQALIPKRTGLFGFKYWTSSKSKRT
jgi:ankyrin repeat protein